MIGIGFSRPKKFKLFSFLTRLWQGWTPYSHTYIRFYMKDISLVFEASYGEVHLITHQNFKDQNVIIREQWIECDDREFDSFISYALSNLQKPYSIRNILGIVMHRLFGVEWFIDKGKAFICSELIARAANMQFNKPIDFVEPTDIWEKLYGKDA